MTHPINPFMGFHTNFDPDTGNLTEPGWPNKEILLLWVTDDLEKAQNKKISVGTENDTTIVFLGRDPHHVIDGNVFESAEDVEFNEVIIEISDISVLTKLSKEFFMKNLESFDMEDSPLGAWFEPESRNEVLMQKAFDKMLKDGLFNHLLPLIYTPFTKEVFQRGELVDDSPDMFTGVIKRKLRKA